MKILMVFMACVSSLLLSGCLIGHNAPLKSQLLAQTHSLKAHKLPLNIGLYMDPELTNFVYKCSPSAYAGSAHYFNFPIGNSLHQVLLEAAKIGFKNVELIDVMPTDEYARLNSQYDGFLLIKKEDCYVNIAYTLFGSAKSQANIVVSARLLSNKLAEVDFSVINGSGESNEKPKGGWEGDFVEGVDRAIEDVADKLVRKLTTSDNIIKYAKEK